MPTELNDITSGTEPITATERIEIVRIGAPLPNGLSEALVPALNGAGPAVRVEVPFAIEGEQARIAVPGPLSRRGTATALLDILEPGASRVEPRCRHFGNCGGCQYQHIAPPKQSQTKAMLLRETLERAGVPLPPQPLLMQSGNPWQYRNRCRLRVEAGRVGYSRRASHVFLPIDECPILSPLLWEASREIVFVTANGTPWPAGAAELELFTTEDDSALQMSLHLRATVATLERGAPADFRALCDALRKRVPQLCGAGLLVQGGFEQTASRRVQERQRLEAARWGEPGLLHHVSGREYSVSRNAFFQINRFLATRMIGLVIGRRSGDLAMDLFAGAGFFALPLTERFASVIAVEIGEPAATDLTRMLQARGPRHRAVRQTTAAFLREYQRFERAQVPDLVVVDPPRAGLGEDVLRELIKLGPRELIYVSCDPATFARDARALVDSRYAVTELHGLDLFPQTLHMETIAVFRRL